MDLIQMLTSQLGIDESQARQGTGTLLAKAKETLDVGDFDQLKGVIPGADAMLDEAPVETEGGGGGLMGMVSGAASKFGLGGVADLASFGDALGKVGIPADKVTGFLTTIVQFVESQGGAGAKALLEKFIKLG